MTEEEWLKATTPECLFESFRGHATDRKLRLFAVACCRRIWEFIIGRESQWVVELAERSADTVLDLADISFLDYDRLTDDASGLDDPFRSAFIVAGHVGHSSIGRLSGLVDPMCDWAIAEFTAREARNVVGEAALETARDMVQKLIVPKKVSQLSTQELRHFTNVLHQTRYTQQREAWNAESITQAHLFRDIFGNPFRPLTLDRSWLTPTVTTLAQTIYDERQLPSGLFDNHRMGVLADALEDAGCDNVDILSHLRNGGEHVRGCWVIDLLLDKE